MLRPVLLSLVLSAVGAGAVAVDQQASDVATWRWRVSTILDAQRAAASPAVTDGAQVAETFDQRYQRYSARGLPEGSSDAGPR
ncbi:MAG: hypothetical protein ABSC25_14180 [Roseiarcus sp.]|jgi:hypothetical protein